MLSCQLIQFVDLWINCFQLGLHGGLTAREFRFSPCASSSGTPASYDCPKTCMLTDDSEIDPRSECEFAWLFVSFVSMWSSNGLVTYPGRTPPLTQR